MTRITRSAALAGSALFAASLLATACSGGSALTSSAGAVHGAAGAGVPERAPAGAPAGAAARSTLTRHAVRITPATQSIIYTASLTVRSADPMMSADRAIAIVTAAGGYTASENATSDVPGRPAGSVLMTVKVPVASYRRVLAELSARSIGRRVALTQQATDVTQQAANVASLVRSQQAAIAALRGLLSRAGSVPALLQVQQQISADQATLNSLVAQQQALNNETSFATISLTVLPTPHQHHHHATHGRRGFVGGLLAGWHGLRRATAAVLTAVGAVLPFAIVLAALAGLGYLVRRRLARRGTRPTTAD
jgi:hypothetical protein